MESLKPMNQYQALTRERKKLVIKGKSMTVPNQALKVRDLLTRFTRSQVVEGGKPHYYDNTEDPEQVSDILDRNFDLADLTEQKAQIEARIQEAKRLKKEKDAEAKRKKDDDAQKAKDSKDATE